MVLSKLTRIEITLIRIRLNYTCLTVGFIRDWLLCRDSVILCVLVLQYDHGMVTPLYHQFLRLALALDDV